MAVRSFELRGMAQELLRDACAVPENWMELLRSVAPFYKYDFESALVIAAQRPDATACATMRQWNRHGLWIRQGSRAIYALDPQNPYHVQPSGSCVKKIARGYLANFAKNGGMLRILILRWHSMR